MFKRFPGIVLLAAACFVGGWMIAGLLPFQLKQDVVRATTGATMPTTSRTVGNAIFHGGFAMILVAAGVSGALAFRASRFPVWVAAASWVVLLSSLAIRHFSPIVQWAMMPLGYLAVLEVAHGWAARRMMRRNGTRLQSRIGRCGPGARTGEQSQAVFP